MKLKTKCDTCNKLKWSCFVKQRTYKCQALGNIPVTSNGRLCRKCFNRIKNVIK